MATPEWATNPVKGGHDIERLNDFVSPASMKNLQGNGVLNGGCDGDGMISPRPQPVSVPDVSQLASRASAGSSSRIDFDGARKNRLRRSMHNADLRGHLTMSLGKSSTTTPAGSNPNPSMLAAQEENIFYSLDSDTNRENTARIETWRHTATTIGRSFLRSPLTPRPFTERELENGIYGESKQSLETLYKADDDLSSSNPSADITPRAYRPNTYSWGPLPLIQDADGPGYAALTMMHRAQEQARLGVDLPPLGIDGVEYRESDRVRKGPVLVPSPKVKKRERGDPVKKPTPLILQPLPITNPTARGDDSQTYTTEGLTLVLSKFYSPGLLPPDVLAALPSPRDLSFLSDPRTPPGYSAHFRSSIGNNTIETLEQKDRNYVAYYIDTLLLRNQSLSKEVKRLEEDVEDAEVSKAMLQGEVNRYYAEGRESQNKLGKLEGLANYLVGRVVPRERSAEVKGVAAEMGIELWEIGAMDESGVAGGEVGDGDVTRRLRRVEEEARYWRARAEAAERFVGALA
ncbi:hypothetical protein K505DRAFT_375799 [Melanomma pulvis-pyrius CBS 109.77]|uniref:Uncharacterized protein n=1 Tax=Melanomma pulvis-pyrius CBS 109.77 TaxID=1314802 RepID=A0A6A6X8E5_9PLEO|nr:hypothetical protein K505DRAFT_375799 [Melanomma pulvis-pyrius CBS 109.77]